MLGVLLLGLITFSSQATGTTLYSVLFAPAVTAYAPLKCNTATHLHLLYKQTQENCSALCFGLFEKEFYLSLVD